MFAAKKRVEVRIPGFIFTVTPQSVLRDDDDDYDGSAMEALEAAVAAGATAVVLADESGNATTRDLFNAALALKDALRGRAALLVADRTDIAASSEADGVVLNDEGVPVVVARKSLNGPCIVACRVRDEKGALVSAKEGADLILAPSAEVVAAVNSKISVPVFAPPADGWAGLIGGEGVASLVESGAQGISLSSAPPDVAAAGAIPGAVEAVSAALAKSSGQSNDDKGGSASAAAASSSGIAAGAGSSSSTSMVRHRPLAR